MSCLLFADDIVLVAKTEDGLRQLMEKTLGYFSKHHLEISHKISKTMFYSAKTGTTKFDDPYSSRITFNLEAVISYKYLGVFFSANPYSMFKSFNENVVKKSRNYLQNILSVSKNGADKAMMAYKMWTSIALPSILYGTEVFPLTQATLSELEKVQSRVGKFILQIPSNSTNLTANLNAGL